MSPRDAFEVLARFLGLWIGVQAFWQLVQTLFYSLTGVYDENMRGIEGGFVLSILYLVLGLAILIRADLIGKFVYGNHVRSDDAQ